MPNPQPLNFWLAACLQQPMKDHGEITCRRRVTPYTMQESKVLVQRHKGPFFLLVLLLRLVLCATQMPGADTSRAPYGSPGYSTACVPRCFPPTLMHDASYVFAAPGPPMIVVPLCLPPWGRAQRVRQ